MGSAVVPTRWRRRVVVALVLFFVALPAIRNRDSYPLSTYPVYASARDRSATITTAVAVAPNGFRYRLWINAIAETDDPLIAEERVRDAIRQNRADSLCVDIVRRADLDPDDAVAIEVVTERFDVVAMTVGRDPNLERVVHARCENPA